MKVLAQQSLRGAAPGQTLQATALVNEVYVRLAQRDARWSDRGHFMRLAGRVMRQILTDYARRRRAMKRNKQVAQEPLAALIDSYERGAVDMIDLDDSLRELDRDHEELVEIVELRFFAGRPEEEIAELLGISTKTAQRRWLAAKTLLRERLGRAR